MKLFIFVGVFFGLPATASVELKHYTVTNLTEYQAIVRIDWEDSKSFVQKMEMPLEPGRCLKIYNAYPLMRSFEDENWPELAPLENKIQVSVHDEEKDVYENLCPLLCDLENYHIAGTAGEGIVSRWFNLNDFELLKTGRPNNHEPCQTFDPMPSF